MEKNIDSAAARVFIVHLFKNLYVSSNKKTNFVFEIFISSCNAKN